MRSTRPMTLRICPGCDSEKMVSTYAIAHGQNLICRSCASKKVNAELHKEKRNNPRFCSIEGCTNKFKGKGYCDKHLWLLRQHSKPEKVKIIDPNRRGHPLEATYGSMKSRCLYPTAPNYKYYGGRGITICERWLGQQGFTHFIEDMGERPNGMTLDRINNNGNYEPSNCRWATWEQQRANQRTKEEMENYK